jgi:hypothetical protein
MAMVTLSGDLAVFVSQVTGLTLQAVQSIIVRGSGRVDNVTLASVMSVRSRRFIALL